MKQTTINSNQNATGNIAPKLSFQQKSMGISLVVIVSAAAFYFLRVAQMIQADAMWQMSVPFPAGYWQIAIATVVLIIVAEVILHTAVTIQTGQAPTATPRDNHVTARSKSNAYNVLAVGAAVTVGSMFFALSPFVIGNLLLLFFVIAEVTRYASQLYYSKER